jgi:hypothetical protein
VGIRRGRNVKLGAGTAPPFKGPAAAGKTCEAGNGMGAAEVLGDIKFSEEAFFSSWGGDGLTFIWVEMMMDSQNNARTRAPLIFQKLLIH